MPTYILEESSYAGPIPDDTILSAEVTGIAEKKQKFTNDDGSDVIRVEFAFVITEVDSAWEGQRIWGTTPTTFSSNPDCKLRAWTSEILGDELGVGFALDTDMLVGMPCRVVVGAREYQKDGQDKTANFVKDVLRARGMARSSVAAAEEPFAVHMTPDPVKDPLAGRYLPL